MPTINISLPEPMREYVETRAASGDYSASEYVRHLIREDKQRYEHEQRDLLWELLAISAKQLDDGDFGDTDMEKLLAEGIARRAAARMTTGQSE